MTIDPLRFHYLYRGAIDEPQNEIYIDHEAVMYWSIASTILDYLVVELLKPDQTLEQLLNENIEQLKDESFVALSIDEQEKLIQEKEVQAKLINLCMFFEQEFNKGGLMAIENNRHQWRAIISEAMTLAPALQDIDNE